MTELGIAGLLRGLFVERLIWEPQNGHKPPGWVGQIQNSGDSVDRLPCTVPLTDAEVAIIDPVYSELRVTNPAAHRVIFLHYGKRQTDTHIAKYGIYGRERLTPDGVRAIREDGERWMSDRLGIPV